MISVCIIAKDAASDLPACVRSVLPLSSDIVVVVDSASADDTQEVATRLGCRTFVHSFTDFSTQRNFAAQKAKHDWIFFIDADEVASPELILEIQAVLRRPQAFVFRVPRLNHIFGKIIHHTNWDPDGIIRLYHKGYATWTGTIHETLTSSSQIKSLKNPLYHYNYRTVTEFLARMNTYTTLEAQDLFSRSIPFSFWQSFWQPTKDFCRRFVWHQGFLDGFHGFYLSLLMSMYHFTIWVKLWQKYHPSG